MILIAENGKLTNEGIAFVRDRYPQDLSGLNANEIQRLFNPDHHLTNTENNLRNRLRQSVIEEEVKRFLGVQPANISSDGSITTSGNPRAGFFATADGSKIVITNRHFSTVFRILVQLNNINVSDSTFNLGTLAPRDVRQWSMVRFLVYALRERNAQGEPNDPIFTDTYAETHTHYLTQRFSDPLNLVASSEIENGNLLRESLSLGQFLELANTPYDQQLRGYRYGGGLQGITQREIVGVKGWAGFLLPGFLGSIDRSDSGAQGLRRCLNNRQASCHDIDLGNSPKYLHRRQPDIIQIFPDRQMIEVIDPTLRWHSKWHNFKTGFYMSVLRMIFQNIQNESWAVVGMDYRSTRYMNVT